VKKKQLERCKIGAIVKTLLPWCAVCALPLVIWLLSEIDPGNKEDPSRWWLSESEIEPDFVLFSTVTFGGIGGLLAQVTVLFLGHRLGWSEKKTVQYGRAISIIAFLVVACVAVAILTSIRP
jgi:hypothetical protein